MAEREAPKVRRDEAEGFLRRWSRRKAEVRSGAAAPSDEASDPENAAAALPQAPEPETTEAPAPVEPEGLPDIESLDASSDFTVFMREGVPEHLRTQALRKLWRADPIFSKLDGLVEYGEDYSIASWPKGTIKTAYRIGRGFASALEKLEAAAPPAPEAPAPGTAAAADSAKAPPASRPSAPHETEAAAPADAPAARIAALPDAPAAAHAPAPAHAPAVVDVPAVVDAPAKVDARAQVDPAESEAPPELRPRRRSLPRRG